MKSRNWKSPGPDVVQGFSLKNVSSLDERVRLQLKECLDSEFVPIWFTRGRTSLLQKDKSKGNVASNYRPTTCLPLMWKLLTGVIADQIYAQLDQEKLLAEQQKRCRKQLGNRLKQIGITARTAEVQKTVLLRTARILKKVLEI